MEDIIDRYRARITDCHGATTGAEAAAAFARRVSGGALDLKFVVEQTKAYTTGRNAKTWIEDHWDAPLPDDWVLVVRNPGQSCGCCFSGSFYVVMEKDWVPSSDMTLADYSQFHPDKNELAGNPLWHSDAYMWIVAHEYILLPRTLSHVVPLLVDVEDDEYSRLFFDGETPEEFETRRLAYAMEVNMTI